MEKGIIIKKENAKKIEAFLKSQQGKARERIFTSATQLEEVIADVKSLFPELLRDKKSLWAGVKFIYAIEGGSRYARSCKSAKMTSQVLLQGRKDGLFELLGVKRVYCESVHLWDIISTTKLDGELKRYFYHMM